ncbi:hypothetical protein BKA04_001283 [Cryobacterium mesophilum]|uniref:Uncharacterized protein n=1 Tax=Terrimesophilobacter mesophilus TaxID=433647 RepID=A0A4R8VAM5_9MICO|nr:hypothetical protein [Terrimesophilobacter mesophilus]MBB5633060.1 hypothetical protein [Terrimesophilobacter mesophilus]TFB79823.1 hypothetical protein E3N84_07060 [Terrimesophilobacter mesophilus]
MIANSGCTEEERVDVTALDQRFWQVKVDGEVAGYVDEIKVAGETRYRARRLKYPDGRWLLIGEWWELDPALAACADVPRGKVRVRKLVVPPQNRWF